jgi:RNA polymerase sigma-70 factor (ECF subfamily)
MGGGRPLREIRSDQPDEQNLIEAARRDPAHFAELYERNFDRVYAYIVRRVRDRSEAQDLTSDVFHRALANLDSFEWRGAPFVAWLYRMAANGIADRAQRVAREQAAPIPDRADAGGAEELADLFYLVRELPADQRRVIEMRFVEGMRIHEIALNLGRSEGAVKQLQFRALENLRARIGDRNG